MVESALWIDGVQKFDLTAVDNDTRRIDRVRLGAVTGMDSGTSGTFFLDAFEFAAPHLYRTCDGRTRLNVHAAASRLINLPRWSVSHACGALRHYHLRHLSSNTATVTPTAIKTVTAQPTSTTPQPPTVTAPGW